MRIGRKSNTQTLSIWANGERVGTWRVPARGEDELLCDDTWLAVPRSAVSAGHVAQQPVQVPAVGEPRRRLMAEGVMPWAIGSRALAANSSRRIVHVLVALDLIFRGNCRAH